MRKLYDERFESIEDISDSDIEKNDEPNPKIYKIPTKSEIKKFQKKRLQPIPQPPKSLKKKQSPQNQLQHHQYHQKRKKN